jgi:hypothetical protein
MNLDYFIARLAENRKAFESLATGVSVEQARWKPAPEKWSIVEVVGHLYDEETEDFRQRLRLLIERPGEPWPQIDPQGWVTEREYNKRDLRESLARFFDERKRSLAWLKKLSPSDVDWSARYERPQGNLRAGDLLASWLAHDFLHLRQLSRLHWEYTAALAAPFSTAYGGSW